MRLGRAADTPPLPPIGRNNTLEEEVSRMNTLDTSQSARLGKCMNMNKTGLRDGSMAQRLNQDWKILGSSPSHVERPLCE